VPWPLWVSNELSLDAKTIALVVAGHSLLHLHEPEDNPTKSSGYEIASGLLQEEAVRLLQSFYDLEDFPWPPMYKEKEVKW
jgi:hypothetical protein